MKNLCWLRRDLRLHDNAALSSALHHGETTVIFIFDSHILEKLSDKADRRVTFIYQSLQEIETILASKGSSLLVAYGKPEEELPRIAKDLEVDKVFYNRDYEPYAKSRDLLVEKKLSALKIDFIGFKDSVFFEKHEVLKNDGEIYRVFTPYKNKWLEKFTTFGQNVSNYECPLKNLRVFKNQKNILKHNWYREIGFEENLPLLSGGTKAALKRLKEFKTAMPDYHEARNFPARPGTSYLSAYLRFGNLSVRDMVRASLLEESSGASTWLSEIIWRDFYQMILDAHPYVVKGAYKPEYNKIAFPNDPKLFKAWCSGNTGVPIVDAAMRCLNASGMMHNRLRMIVASYLCKILLVDWRKGEAYFAAKLLDFDLAANNGGWQWSAGSGCDAQPYFRIFNPYTQSKNFDPKGEFIRSWCPELSQLSDKEIHCPLNVEPIVDYQKNRQKCLSLYSIVKDRDMSRQSSP